MAMYIHLYHGRKDPGQDMDEWGENGPLIGPIEGLHATYVSHIRPIVDGDACEFINYHEDMVYFDGMFYGDWSVIDDEEVNSDPEYYGDMRRVDPRSEGFSNLCRVPDPMPDPWRPEMNTRISYQYRDGGNYKFPVTVVVAGELKASDLQAFVDDGTDFIPYLVGLPSGQDQARQYGSYPDSQIDHVFNQFFKDDKGNIDPDCFEPTTEPPTVQITAAELRRRFDKHKAWPVAEAMKHYSLD